MGKCTKVDERLGLCQKPVPVFLKRTKPNKILNCPDKRRGRWERPLRYAWPPKYYLVALVLFFRNLAFGTTPNAHAHQCHCRFGGQSLAGALGRTRCRNGTEKGTERVRSIRNFAPLKNMQPPQQTSLRRQSERVQSKILNLKS